MDPFASVDQERGKISDSQEEYLHYSHFLFESSPTDTVFHSAPGDEEEGDHAPPYRVTERIVMVTPPETPADGGNHLTTRQEELGLGLGFPEEEIVRRFETSDGKSPVDESVDRCGEGVKLGLSRRKNSPACERNLPQGKGSMVKNPGASKRKSSEVDSSQETGDSSDRDENRCCGLPEKDPLKRGSGESSGKVQEPLIPTQEEAMGSDVSKAHANSEAEDGVQSLTDEFVKFRYVKSGISPRYPPLKILKDVIGNSRPASEGVLGSRKLPPSIQVCGNDGDGGTSTATLPPSPITEEQTSNADSISHAHNPSVSNQDHVLEKDRNSVFPANLLDVVKAFSANPSRTFEGVDILEVAAMKGIHFPPPRWWRPGGYNVQKHKMPE